MESGKASEEPFERAVSELSCAVAVAAGIRFLQMQRRQEEDALAERRRRRAERLRDSGMSEADFDLMMQDRRTALAKKRKKRSHKIP